MLSSCEHDFSKEISYVFVIKKKLGWHIRYVGKKEITTRMSQDLESEDNTALSKPHALAQTLRHKTPT